MQHNNNAGRGLDQKLARPNDDGDDVVVVVVVDDDDGDGGKAR